jgi:hypothetical protein
MKTKHLKKQAIVYRPYNGIWVIWDEYLYSNPKAAKAALGRAERETKNKAGCRIATVLFEANAATGGEPKEGEGEK